MNRTYDVSSNKCKSAKAATVDHPYGHRRAVDFLVGKVDVDGFDWHAEVGVLGVVVDHRRLNRVAAALDVHPVKVRCFSAECVVFSLRLSSATRPQVVSDRDLLPAPATLASCALTSGDQP